MKAIFIGIILVVIGQNLAREENVRAALETKNDEDFPKEEKLYPEEIPVNDDRLWKYCEKKKGLTWQWREHFCENGLDYVHCTNCNPYQGDTSCMKELPILCIYKAKVPRPSYEIKCSSHAMPGEFYCGWTGGYINVSKPYRGCHIQSKEHADKLCKLQFGDCWEMASHHDGHFILGMNENQYSLCSWNWDLAQSGGWGFHAYGNLADATKDRFWVHIRDQPGNCWN